tara:strand:+ start:1451 stop:1882 length:432 start_codon:yes stop_codon:yes gene_type:complete
MDYIHILVILLSLFLICKLWDSNKFIIKPSPIHGQGLFTTRSYKPGDIIIKNVFPNKNNNRKIKYSEDIPDFQDVISHEGKFINHCSKHSNSLLITNDYKQFPLIATKNINKNEEITANYDSIHKKIPFIASSIVTKNNHYQC